MSGAPKELFDEVVREYIYFVNEQVGTYMSALAGFAGHHARVSREVPPVFYDHLTLTYPVFRIWWDATSPPTRPSQRRRTERDPILHHGRFKSAQKRHPSCEEFHSARQTCFSSPARQHVRSRQRACLLVRGDEQDIRPHKAGLCPVAIRVARRRRRPSETGTTEGHCQSVRVTAHSKGKAKCALTRHCTGVSNSAAHMTALPF